MLSPPAGAHGEQVHLEPRGQPWLGTEQAAVCACWTGDQGRREGGATHLTCAPEPWGHGGETPGPV